MGASLVLLLVAAAAPAPYAGFAVVETSSVGPALVVSKVAPDGPSAQAGLHEGDAVVAIEDSEHPTRADLEGALTELRAGDRLSMRVRRGEALIDLSIRLTERGPPPVVVVPPIEDPKRADLALAFSWGATLIPVAAGVLAILLTDDLGDALGVTSIGLGLTFGPAAGYLYLGEVGAALAGSGYRLAAYGTAVGFAFGVVIVVSDEYNDFPESGLTLMIYAIPIALLVGAILTVWDLVDVYFEAERHNERRAPSLALVPTVLLDAERRVVPALSLGFRF